MRTKGKITTWNDDKGYGFITPFDGSDRVFIHITALGNRNRRPTLNDVVTYSLSKDKRGRTCAANATLAGDKLVKKAPRKSSKGTILFAVLFLAGAGLSALIGRLPAPVAIGYLGMSLITFLAYAADKAAARAGRWRTAEGTLLLLGLAGGWPGALIAQQNLRHKSKKGSFRAALWLTVIVNCAAFAWLQTESGRAALDDLLATASERPGPYAAAMTSRNSLPQRWTDQGCLFFPTSEISQPRSEQLRCHR